MHELHVLHDIYNIWRPKRVQSTIGNVYSLYIFTNYNNDVAGNIAFNKTASTGRKNETYPVDGSIDEHCAVPSTSAWWKVDLGENYKIKRVIIYNSYKGE